MWREVSLGPPRISGMVFLSLGKLEKTIQDDVGSKGVFFLFHRSNIRLIIYKIYWFLLGASRKITINYLAPKKVKPIYARMIPDRHRMTLRNTRPVWKISWASFLLQQIDPPTIKHLSSTVDQSEKEEMDVLPVTPSGPENHLVEEYLAGPESEGVTRLLLENLGSSVPFLLVLQRAS